MSAPASASVASSASASAALDEWGMAVVSDSAPAPSAAPAPQRPTKTVNVAEVTAPTKAAAPASAASSTSSGNASSASSSSSSLNPAVSHVTDVANLTAEEKQCLEMFNPLNKFVPGVESLLEAVAKVFPMCMATKFALTYFRSTYKTSEKDQDELIRTWHATMKPFYDDCTSTDPVRHERVIKANIDIFVRLDLAGKWGHKGFKQTSKERLIQHILRLNKFADQYCGFHSRFRNDVLKATESIKQRVDRQEIGENQWQAMLETGMEVANGMSDEDLKQVSKMLPEMMKTMGNDLGGLAGGGGMGGGGAGGIPGFDMSSLLGMLGKK
jgi:hypothetical protein